MLTITIPETESFNEVTNEFVTLKEQTIQLEHSLVSLYKWESKWNKPFISRDQKSVNESIDYIRCMTITQNVKPETYNRVTNDILDIVRVYIEAPMTATTFSKQDKTANRDIVTAEIIYYWMISFNIPFECQKWHLNQLLTLIEVCERKNSKPKKMSQKEQMNRNRALNEARKQQLQTNG